jgi:hypothetical protein
MDIYSPVVITEQIRNNFKPTRLYIKELNGLKYFGKTTKSNIESYTGSGTYWLRHIKKYGKENIKTIWISDWYTCPVKLQEFAIKCSKDNDIVESKDWANLIAENGLSGGAVQNNYITTYNKLPRKLETINKMKNSLAGKLTTLNSHTPMANNKRSITIKAQHDNAPVAICQHCNKSGKFIGMFKSLHFDRCKMRKDYE